MIQLLLTSVLILLLIGLINSRKLVNLNMGALGFLIGTFYFLFVPLLVLLIKGELIEPNLPGISIISENQQLAIFFLLVYIIELLIVLFLIDRPKTKRIKAVNIPKEKTIFVISIVCYFILSLILIINVSSSPNSHWYRSRGEFLQRTSELGNIIVFLIWGLRFIIVSFTFELLNRKQISLKFSILLVIIICAFELAYMGNRIVVLMFGISGFVYIYKQYGRGILMTAILVISPLLIGLGVYQDVRSMLFHSSALTIINTVINIVLSPNQYYEDGYLRAFLKIFESTDTLLMFKVLGDAGNKFDLLNGATLLKMVTWFIPRSIWLEKPESITQIVGQIFMPGESVSLTSLIFGEIHLNFGIAGMFIFPFLILMLLNLIRIFSKDIALNNYFNFIICFLLIRLPISDMIVSIVFAFFFYKAIDILLRIYVFKSSFKGIRTW